MDVPQAATILSAYQEARALLLVALHSDYDSLEVSG